MGAEEKADWDKADDIANRLEGIAHEASLIYWASAGLRSSPGRGLLHCETSSSLFAVKRRKLWAIIGTYNWRR